MIAITQRQAQLVEAVCRPAEAPAMRAVAAEMGYGNPNTVYDLLHRLWARMGGEPGRMTGARAITAIRRIGIRGFTTDEEISQVAVSPPFPDIRPTGIIPDYRPHELRFTSHLG